MIDGGNWDWLFWLQHKWRHETMARIIREEALLYKVRWLSLVLKSRDGNSTGYVCQSFVLSRHIASLIIIAKKSLYQLKDRYIKEWSGRHNGHWNWAPQPRSYYWALQPRSCDCLPSLWIHVRISCSKFSPVFGFSHFRDVLYRSCATFPPRKIAVILASCLGWLYFSTSPKVVATIVC